MTRLKTPGNEIPLPRPTVTSKPFWDACARGELVFQRCSNCQTAMFNPTPICRACGGRVLEWKGSKGLGTIYSWTVAWRPQSPSFETPYAAAIVELDEGYQMLTNIVNCEVEDLHLGMRVSVTFHAVRDGIHLPYFRPAT